MCVLCPWVRGPVQVVQELKSVAEALVKKLSCVLVQPVNVRQPQNDCLGRNPAVLSLYTHACRIVYANEIHAGADKQKFTRLTLQALMTVSAPTPWPSRQPVHRV